MTKYYYINDKNIILCKDGSNYELGHRYIKKIILSTLFTTLSVLILKSKKFYMPRAGIEPALSGPQPDVLPLYYRGENRINKILICSSFTIEIKTRETVVVSTILC